MNRRQFVAGLGVLAGGGAATMGTGAFDSVEAQRNVDVAVAGDASAYLGIQPTDGKNGNYVDTTTNNALSLSLTDSNGNIGDGVAGGEGLNANAITGFDDVFEIRNRGTQPIEVQVTPLAFGDVSGLNFPPEVDGALAVLLMPQAPDKIDLELSWSGLDFIAIKDLAPGQKIKFNVVAVALMSDAIGETSIDDQIEITAEEV